MEAIKIVLLCVFTACCYGIAHDLVTAHVCVEYFTIAHDPILKTESPILLGISWGIIATWWVGAILGVLLAASARLGYPPYTTVQEVARPVVILMFVVGVCALVAGITGYTLANAGTIKVPSWIADAIPAERHSRFLADAWAHNTSYAVGFVGGIVLCILTAAKRFKARRRPGETATT